jgi:hypothetical protein
MRLSTAPPRGASSTPAPGASVGGRCDAGETNVRETSASQTTSGTQQKGSLYTVEEDALHASKLSESTKDRAADVSSKEARDRTDSGFPIGVGSAAGPVATSSGTSYSGNAGAGASAAKGGAASRKFHTSARVDTTRIRVGGGDWMPPVEANHAPRTSGGESSALPHRDVRASVSCDAGPQCRWHDTAELWQVPPSSDVGTGAAASSDLREGVPVTESMVDDARDLHSADTMRNSGAGAAGAARPTQYSTVAVEYTPFAG